MSPSPLLVPIGGFLTEFHSIHSSSSLVCLRSTHSACVIPTQLRQTRSRAACSFFGWGFLMRCVTPTPRRIHTGILRLLISLHRNRHVDLLNLIPAKYSPPECWYSFLTLFLRLRDVGNSNLSPILSSLMTQTVALSHLIALYTLTKPISPSPPTLLPTNNHTHLRHCAVAVEMISPYAYEHR